MKASSSSLEGKEGLVWGRFMQEFENQVSQSKNIGDAKIVAKPAKSQDSRR